MEFKILPIAAMTLGVGVVVLAIRAGKNNSSSQAYIDAPNSSSSTTKFDAKEVAQTVYIAMNRYGTDEDMIMQALTEINESQFASVILAFGKRNYNTWTGDEYGFWKYSLKEWLASELSSSSYLTLKSKFKKYL